MATRALSAKGLISELGDDDTLEVVTVEGDVRRIRKSDLDLASADAEITDAYINENGDLIIVVGDGDGEQGSDGPILAVNNVAMYVRVERSIEHVTASYAATLRSSESVTEPSAVIHAARSFGDYDVESAERLRATATITNISMEVVA